MPVLLAVLMIFAAAPVLDMESSANDPVARIEASPAAPEANAPVAPGLDLREIQVPERAEQESAAAVDAQDMPQRGSFWWLVGAIVIAGIILAVVLD